MSWAFNAKGTKEECAAQLDAATPPGDAADAKQWERVLASLRDELACYESDSREMSISASGHAPGDAGGDRSFSIWISGKAKRRLTAPVATSAPRTEEAPAHTPTRRR